MSGCEFPQFNPLYLSPMPPPLTGHSLVSQLTTSTCTTVTASSAYSMLSSLPNTFGVGLLFMWNSLRDNEKHQKKSKKSIYIDDEAKGPKWKHPESKGHPRKSLPHKAVANSKSDEEPPTKQLF
ncbi:hypothetical protein FRC11_012426 [Ceratobasidium sp. 423]|nr:hypothetical protein FRC11_012426 [Ceratobasidium sp. 423]